MTGILESTAMIVRLFTSTWTATKNDPLIAAEVTRQYDAAERAAKVHKRLIDKEALKPVRYAIAAARSWHNQLTLPWGDHGERLLPVNMHDTYVEKMESCMEQVDAARRAFVARYESLITEAQDTLGKMFNEDDYPLPGSITEKFGVRYEISPVPAASNFVANLADEHATRIKADLERRAQIKMDNAMVQLYERVEAGLRRLVERLGVDDKGKPKRIHATALEALQQLADAVPSMNLASDRQLDEISHKIRDLLTGLEIHDLRPKSQKAEVVAAVVQKREKLAGQLEKVALSYFGTEPATETEQEG